MNEIVGPEGLAANLAALASQLGALEKSTNQQFGSLAQAVEMQAAGIRRETASEAQRLDTLLSENANRSNMLVDALRAELLLQIATIRAEIANVAAVADQRMSRFMEVKDLHWTEHRETHAQQAEAIRLAYAGMDKRLDAMNEFRAQISDMTGTFATKESVDKSVGNVEARVERGELDARRRDELKEAKINDLEKQLGREMRAEVRPVQDMKVGQGALVAAIAVAVSLISIIVWVLSLAPAG
jgi:hypothetical protein